MLSPPGSLPGSSLDQKNLSQNPWKISSNADSRVLPETYSVRLGGQGKEFVSLMYWTLVQPLSVLREFLGQQGLGETCGDVQQEPQTQTLGQGSFPEGDDSKQSPSEDSGLLRQRPGPILQMRQQRSGKCHYPAAGQWRFLTSGGGLG